MDRNSCCHDDIRVYSRPFAVKNQPAWIEPRMDANEREFKVILNDCFLSDETEHSDDFGFRTQNISESVIRVYLRPFAV